MEVTVSSMRHLAEHAQATGQQDDWMRCALTWMDQAETEISRLKVVVGEARDVLRDIEALLK